MLQMTRSRHLRIAATFGFALRLGELGFGSRRASTELASCHAAK